MNNYEEVLLTDRQFAEWMSSTVEYGYGSGEEYILPALRWFLVEHLAVDSTYDFRVLEEKFGGLAAWLFIELINDVYLVDYGTSPRFGFLTESGHILKEYMSSKTLEQLTDVLNTEGYEEDGTSVKYEFCESECCTEEGVEKCSNPLF